jgi:hypothetical protein
MSHDICIDSVTRNLFTPSEPTSRGSAFRDGRMISRVVSGLFEQHEDRQSVHTEFFPEHALGFRVTATVRVTRASTEAWVAVPIGGYAETGIKLELNVTRRSTGEVLGSDMKVLDSRNTTGFVTTGGGDLAGTVHELTCNGELGDLTSGVKVTVALHNWTHTFLPSGATAEAEVNVRSVNFERCCVRPLEAPPGMIPLHSWWSQDRGDNFCTSQAAWAGCTNSMRFPAHRFVYRFVRFEGFAFDPDQPQPEHTVPLHSWYNDFRGDNFLTSDPRWGGDIDPNKDGYVRFRREGFIHDPRRPQPPGSVPLFSWWNPSLSDNFATSDPRWSMPISDIELNGEHIVNGPSQAGYTLYRLEGFIMS